MSSPVFTITIPGDPVPQGRPRIGRWKANDGREGVTARDPAKSKNWKAAAKYMIYQALQEQGRSIPLIREGPVLLTVVAYFVCPKSDWRKRAPQPMRPHTKRGDLDNIVKAVKDAANGVLWTDDAQVQQLTASKWIAAQGDPGRLEVTVKIPKREEER